ncbi:hypothetical protein [Neokomagataea anthophila]|uniref:Uncharacterized protein n=1 Tax=Neokomagataea anthophila TaxID=2826925 RepID=A0ABS5E6I2_9PROT|nr:hypothetical protein [Neokomagataea anthophila]MBR0559528.1 hypothetical protein [Neokomagataea anthophila]
MMNDIQEQQEKKPVKLVGNIPVLTPENFAERFERALWNAREHHLNTFKERDDA